MRLLCDENVRGSIVRLLDQEGHDVERVQDTLDTGYDDADIVAYCRTEDRLVLTNDEDFFAFDDHPGVLFLTAQRTPPREVAVAIQYIERHLDADTVVGRVLYVPDGWGS